MQDQPEKLLSPTQAARMEALAWQSIAEHLSAAILHQGKVDEPDPYLIRELCKLCLYSKEQIDLSQSSLLQVIQLVLESVSGIAVHADDLVYLLTPENIESCQFEMSKTGYLVLRLPKDIREYRL